MSLARWASDPSNPPYGIKTVMENDVVNYKTPDLGFAVRSTSPAGPVKVLAGEVHEDGVGVEGRLVRVHHKATGDVIGEFRTASDGSFLIPVQFGDVPHYIIAFDDPEGEDYNAKIYDNVIPG